MHRLLMPMGAYLYTVAVTMKNKTKKLSKTNRLDLMPLLACLPLLLLVYYLKAIFFPTPGVAGIWHIGPSQAGSMVI